MTESPPPFARTSLEAQLYVTLCLPCRVCGLTTLQQRGTSRGHAGGFLVRGIITRCANCGDDDEHTFRLPLREDPDLFFGGPERSQLLDPGDWLLVAGEIHADVPEDDLQGLPADQLAHYRNLMQTVVAAVEEAMKFLDDGADAIAPDAFFGEEGRKLYNADPATFRRDRLAERLRGYQALLRRYGG
jgi:hypothetical protein